MASIEQRVTPAPSRHEQSQAALRHMRWSARWMSSFRGEPGYESHASLRPEDLARSEVFFNSTGCWV